MTLPLMKTLWDVYMNEIDKTRKFWDRAAQDSDTQDVSLNVEGYMIIIHCQSTLFKVYHSSYDLSVLAKRTFS